MESSISREPPAATIVKDITVAEKLQQPDEEVHKPEPGLSRG